jgi:hypothetical protein
MNQNVKSMALLAPVSFDPVDLMCVCKRGMLATIEIRSKREQGEVDNWMKTHFRELEKEQ